MPQSAIFVSFFGAFVNTPKLTMLLTITNVFELILWVPVFELVIDNVNMA